VSAEALVMAVMLGATAGTVWLARNELRGFARRGLAALALTGSMVGMAVVQPDPAWVAKCIWWACCQAYVVLCWRGTISRLAVRRVLRSAIAQAEKPEGERVAEWSAWLAFRVAAWGVGKTPREYGEWLIALMEEAWAARNAQAPSGSQAGPGDRPGEAG
jgi:hypothetical protein